MSWSYPGGFFNREELVKQYIQQLYTLIYEMYSNTPPVRIEVVEETPNSVVIRIVWNGVIKESLHDRCSQALAEETEERDEEELEREYQQCIDDLLRDSIEEIVNSYPIPADCEQTDEEGNLLYRVESYVTEGVDTIDVVTRIEIDPGTLVELPDVVISGILQCLENLKEWKEDELLPW